MDDKLSDLLTDDETDADRTPEEPGRRRRFRARRAEPARPAGPAEGILADVDDDFVDQVPPRSRLSLPTLALCVLLVMAVSFGAGVLVQKHHDRGLSSATGLPSGLAGPGSGTLPGLGAQGTGGSSSGDGSSSGSQSATPAVVGTIVSIKGSDITVRDLGGKTHLVRTTGATSVTVPWRVDHLRPGTTVSVTGTTSNGVVTATSITAR